MRLFVLIVAGIADPVALVALATGLELDAAVSLIAVANSAGLLAMIWPRREAEPSTVGLLRSATVEKTCSACPAQWEGTLADGRFVYVRYRHGWLSIGFGTSPDDAVARAMDDRVEFVAQIGDEHDGWLEWREVLEAVER